MIFICKLFSLTLKSMHIEQSMRKMRRNVIFLGSNHNKLFFYNIEIDTLSLNTIWTHLSIHFTRISRDHRDIERGNEKEANRMKMSCVLQTAQYFETIKGTIFELSTTLLFVLVKKYETRKNLRKKYDISSLSENMMILVSWEKSISQSCGE